MSSIGGRERSSPSLWPAQASPGRAALPEVIGSYRIRRRLPSPTSVDVYLAREDGPLGFAREVVLKVAPRDDALAEELAREATAVAQLNHPAIVRMFSFFEHEGRIVLVLERFDGTSLAKVLQASRRRKLKLPDAAVFYVGHRIASALAHAHGEQGRTPVVHRGISPTAVVVGWDGLARLSGYGLAKVVGRTPDTAVGLVKGVSGYMAPEQIRGERVSERTDVYQLGLLLFEMLSGEPPPGGPQSSRQMELVHMMAGERLPPVANVRPRLPRELVAVFDAALEPDPEKRGITAKEIARWLEKTVDVEGGRAALAERATSVRSQTLREDPEAPRQVTLAPTRRTSPRFPGVSTRLTGRVGVEELAPSSRPMPPRRTDPPARRSAHPPRPQSPPIPAPASVRPPPLAPLPTVALEEAPEPLGAPQHASVPAPLALGPAVATSHTKAGMSTLMGLPPPPAPIAALAPALTGAPGSRASLAPPGLRHDGLRDDRRDRPRASRAGLVAAVAGGGILVVGLVVVGLVVLLRSSSRGKDEEPRAEAPAPPAPVSASVEVAPPPAPPAPPSSGDAPPAAVEAIPPRRAGVIVHSPVAGTVYHYSTPVGETEVPFVVPCGRVFLRVGKTYEPTRQIQWLTGGVSTILPCGQTTTIDVPLKAAPPPHRKAPPGRR